MDDTLTSFESRKIQAVAFDFDGTLLDSLPLHSKAWEDAVREVVGRPPPREMVIERVAEGLTAPDIAARLVEAGVIPAEQAEEVIRRKRELSDRYLPTEAHLFPEARETLLELRARGYPLAIASGARRGPIETILAREGIRAFFDRVYGIEDVGEGKKKPEPEVLLQITRDLEVPVDRLLFVGDTVTDAQTATQAGAPFVLARLKDHYPPGVDAAGEGGVRVIGALIELLQLLPGS